MKTSDMLVLAGALILLQACESLVHGMSEEIAITTSPAGAELTLSDGQHCFSPCRLTASRSEVLSVTATKAECRIAHEQIVPAVTEEATDFGGILDYRLGGAYRLEPNPLTIPLICGRAAQRPPLDLTSEERDLIKEFGQSKSTGEYYPTLKTD